MELKFPTTYDLSKSDIKKAQHRILNMAVTVCSILNKYNIDYFITSGTLLGAVRHKGFIPWDDDFDIFLFEEDYSKAIKILSKKLPKHLIVHNEKSDPLYFKAWASIKDLTTKCLTNNQYNSDNKLLLYPALSIDLFKLKKLNKEEAQSYKTREALAFFKKKHELNIISKEKYDIEIKNIKVNETNIKHTIRPKKHFHFFLLLSEPIHYDDIFPLRKIKFENQLFSAPRNCKKILTSLYGDYNIIPNYSERKGHFTKIVFGNKNLHLPSF